ncbi:MULTISPECIES: vitamin K epoxide reductase family protein [Pseudanabaena]|uniref:Vitamin K epoxide reductase n=2 Tax=Pseudanabaena TaxID=1152 RepID=L8N7R7_9CYAN|nr:MULTISPECIES: vitamin K epoxide reductase family protein [Pseudanabaena]ELS34268.1 Vitamin K epoxide reductase [Pseudanabaena biceps PCC 7429]MDG3493565.1 vitamin K epoxide reductase family protein [Pseudanabaena catenata USMAC16]
MRKKTEPWLHRWSRPAIVALSLFGFSLTTYLTVTHFLGQKVALCSVEGSGCDLVLSSEYAKIFGVPLTIFGALGYLMLGLLAGLPLLLKRDDPKAQVQIKETANFLMFMVSSSTFVFSGYLMYLLASGSIGGQPQVCLYCISSAVTMMTIWLLTIFGNTWKDVGQLFFTGAIVAIVTLTGTLGVYASQGKIAAQSNSFAGRLAQHLTATNAKMYGAYWCPHCKDQKEKFGDAKKLIPYVECAPNPPNGAKSEAELCKQKGIEGYPTWEIQGKMLSGERTLEELANASGYTGDRN